MARTATAAATVAQLSSLVAILAGLYLLIGLAWTLVVGGVLVLVASTAVELLAARARADVRSIARSSARSNARARREAG